MLQARERLELDPINNESRLCCNAVYNFHVIARG